MKILILSFYFKPDLCAGSFRMEGLVEALHQQIDPDVCIDILTTQPNRYVSYSQNALSIEVQGRITIRRFSLPAHRSGMLDQSLAFFAYAYQVVKETQSSKYDLVFATSSRLLTATLGAFIAFRVRARLYLDIRDIFVDTLQHVSLPFFSRLLIPVLRLLENLTLRRAAHVNLVSAGFVEYFMNRHPSISFSVITNGIDNFFINIDYAKQTVSLRTVVLYAGNIGDGQGLIHIIPEIARKLRDSHEFWIVGDGGQRPQLERSVKDLENVKIKSPVGREDLLTLYRESDILFLHLNDYPAFLKVLPSKLFEYAATGKPIVAGVAGYPALFLKDLPRVVTFQPSNVGEGIAAIRDIKLGLVSRQSFIEHYRRVKLSQDLADSLLNVAKKDVKE